MYATRELPASCLDSTGRITQAAFNVLASRAGNRGMRFVPTESRPKRYGYCDALWLDHSGNVSLILQGSTLVLAERT